MSDSKAKWNAKYSTGSSFSNEPDKFLLDHVHLFKNGSVLDFACGTGRNAVWLASRGFSIDGADISDVGLRHLETAAMENQLNIRSMAMDLTDEDQLIQLKTYDNIIINMYKPAHEVLLKLPRCLNEGGILLICTHNWKQVVAGKFKQEFCLNPNELIDLKWDMKLLKHSTFELKSGFYDGYVFTKL